MRGFCRVLPFLQVTGIALRGEAIENAHGQLLVTFVALHRCVRSQKREAILVILHLLYRNVPAFDGVALGAV